MPRINQLPAASSVASTDVVAIDTQDKTYRVLKSTLFDGYYTAAEVDAAIAQSTADVIRTGDVVNNLTSTSTTAPLSSNMGKTLNNNIINLVTKSTYVGTTDSDGDISILNIITGRVFVSAIPNRTYGDETYSSWFGVIVGCGAGGQVSVKCVNDNNQKLVSQKVAIDVYYIDGQQLGSP